MLQYVLIFVAGLALLVKGSDYFIDSAVRIAKTFGVSEFVIGLTLVGIGTSLPEIGNSLTAAFTKNPGLALGDLVGSNIANIGLVLGLSSLIMALKIKPEIFDRDGTVMLGVAVFFYMFSLDGVVNFFDGLVLLTIFLTYIMSILKFKPPIRRLKEFRDYVRGHLREDVTKRDAFGEFVDRTDFTKIVDFTDGLIEKFSGDWIMKLWNPRNYLTLAKRTKERLMRGLVREFIISLMGLVMVLYGARLLVEGAVNISAILGVPQTVIGLTMVAIGTSLPELMVSLTSLKKGYANIVVGNIIGSNITNLSLIMGTTAMITPIPIPNRFLYYVIPTMILLTIISLLSLRSGWEIKKREGSLFLLVYSIFTIWLILTS